MADSSYDPNLTYEERRRLRQQKREMKLNNVSLSGVLLSVGGIGV
jgi:hypothetical protein